MRVFVTGASGFVGSAVAAELVKNGHTILALARSDASAAKLAALGYDVLRGDIEDGEILKAGASACDGVCHLAFNHDDFSKWGDSCAAEVRAIDAFATVLAGTKKMLVVTGGVALSRPLPGESVVTEQACVTPDFVPRKVQGAAENARVRGVKCAMIRLPPTTHGDGDKGVVPTLIKVARAKGVSAYVADGSNHLPACHRLDAAKVYRLALERGESADYHAIAEQGIEFKKVAEAIAAGLGVSTASIAKEEVPAHFGFFGMFATLDVVASSEWTQQTLGWKPVQPPLLEVVAAHYFKTE